MDGVSRNHFKEEEEEQKEKIHNTGWCSQESESVSGALQCRGKGDDGERGAECVGYDGSPSGTLSRSQKTVATLCVLNRK